VSFPLIVLPIPGSLILYTGSKAWNGVIFVPVFWAEEGCHLPAVPMMNDWLSFLLILPSPYLPSSRSCLYRTPFLKEKENEGKKDGLFTTN
jgi:hypothetical protein